MPVLLAAETMSSVCVGASARAAERWQVPPAKCGSSRSGWSRPGPSNLPTKSSPPGSHAVPTRLEVGRIHCDKKEILTRMVYKMGHSRNLRWFGFAGISLYALFSLGRMYQRIYIALYVVSRSPRSIKPERIYNFHINLNESHNMKILASMRSNNHHMQDQLMINELEQIDVSVQNTQIMHAQVAGQKIDPLEPVEADPLEPVEAADLAIGMAQGVHELHLAVFIKSLRQFSNCTIILFIDINMTSKSRVLCERYNVTVVMYDPKKIEPAFIRNFHPSTYRWFLMHQFLKKSTVPFKRILLADIRDTAFQADPFSIVDDQGLYVFAEGKRFKEDGHTTSWVSDCFGTATADSFSEKWIICSGISIGTADAVGQYLELMVSTMSTPSFVECERNGVDQGAHNVLVYTNQIPGLHLLSENDGYVAHMQNTLMYVQQDGLLDSPGFRLTVKPGWSKRQQDTSTRIVHQYDREIHLQAYLFGRYMEWTELESAPGTGACAGYSLVEEVDLLCATGDLDDGHTNSTGSQGCCRDCSARHGCNAFLYIAGKGCWLKGADGPRPLQFAIPFRGSTTGWRKLLHSG